MTYRSPTIRWDLITPRMRQRPAKRHTPWHYLSPGTFLSAKQSSRELAGQRVQPEFLSQVLSPCASVPILSEERVTLNIEQLDPGSLLDTHACLEATENTADICPSRGAKPAQGFLRMGSAAGLSVQIYAVGPVGVQAFGSNAQLRLTIPNFIATWRSEPIKIWGAFALLIFALVKEFPRIDKLFTARRKGTDAQGSEHRPSDGSSTLVETVHMVEVIGGKTGESTKKGGPSSPVIPGVVALLLGGLLVECAPTSVRAEPVEVRQGNYTGAGASFHRGAECLVVTARHVVSEIGTPVTVLDRTGAKAEASRTYDNEPYDLALITLRDSPPTVACTAIWPDVAWLQRANLSTEHEFQVFRDYPSGKETIVRLKYAGGTKDRLALAPVDKLTVRESDSGAIVMLDGRPAGIVQSVDTGIDRVNVLRFDMIDQLIGDRFRNSGGRVIAYAGVLWRGRENPTWSAYVKAWITENIGGAVIPASSTGGVTSKAACAVKVEVLSWDQVRVPNPDFDSVQLQLKACGKRGLFYEQVCSSARQAAASTPRQLMSQKIALNVEVTPTGAPPLSKLQSSTHVPRSAQLTRPEIEPRCIAGRCRPASYGLTYSRRMANSCACVGAGPAGLIPGPYTGALEASQPTHAPVAQSNRKHPHWS